MLTDFPDDDSSSPGVQTDLNEDEAENVEAAAGKILDDLRAELLKIKGVGEKIVQTILSLPQWTRRNVESVKFMKTVNVGPIVQILEEYRSKLENI